MNQCFSEGYMSPVCPSLGAGSVISLSMFCPHMGLLADTVVWVRQKLALHVCKKKKKRARCWMVDKKTNKRQTKDSYSNPMMDIQSCIYNTSVKFSFIYNAAPGQKH